MRKSLGTTRSKALWLSSVAREGLRSGVRLPSRLRLTGEPRVEFAAPARGAVGRPAVGPNADGRSREGSRIGEAAAASVPGVAAARCLRPPTGIGACGEPGLRWA